MSAVSDGHDAHHRALQGLLPDQRWMDGRKLKTCAKCHQNFTLDYFHSSRRARTGCGTNVYRHAYCASCRGVPPFPLIHTVDTEPVLHRLNREEEEKEKTGQVHPPMIRHRYCSQCKRREEITTRFIFLEGREFVCNPCFSR